MRLIMRAIEALIRANIGDCEPTEISARIKEALSKSLIKEEVDEALGIPLIEAIGSLTLLDVIYLSLVKQEVDNATS